MKYYDLVVLGPLIVSSILTFLTLIAGYKQGVLDSVCISTYGYSGNDHQNSASPSSALTVNYDGLVAWSFSTHYLSICGSYTNGTGTKISNYKACEVRSLGWTFRSDDPFIVHWSDTTGSPTINTTGIPMKELQTSVPAGLLVAGLSMAVFALGASLVWQRGAMWMTLEMVRATALSAIFFTTSSGLITHAIDPGHIGSQGNKSGVNGFLAFTWVATAFMYVAFVGAVADIVAIKRKKRIVG